MLHLTSSGSGYGIGFEHGAAYPKEVQLAYLTWGQIAGSEASGLDTRIHLVGSRLERLFPDLAVEMQGIADGAELSYREIVTLNCFEAIIGLGWNSSSCSTIGFADSDVGVLLGKTADSNVTELENLVLWQRYQPMAGEGHCYIHYGCAGTVWSEGGLNDSGLGMVLNGLPGYRTPGSGSTPNDVPYLLLPRCILQQCRDVQDALDFIGQYNVMQWGVSITLADIGGDLALVEVVPGTQAIRHPNEDYLIHTNHCISVNKRLDPRALATARYSSLPHNSQARYRTLQKIVPLSSRTLASMKALLRDRSVPGAISQNGEHSMHTFYAFIVAPQQGRIWGAEGYPPNVSFVQYGI